MSKLMQQITFSTEKCRVDLSDFRSLLDSKVNLNERTDIQRFFKTKPQLSAFLGTYVPGIGPAQCIAFEFPFMGDFSADVIVGKTDSKGSSFCVIEFEDGKPDSIFKKVRSRSTTEWSRRFERGFSQLVDWFQLLDDFKKTDRFRDNFGNGHVKFSALLVLGRSSGISEYDRKRLRWRTEKVQIDSHSVECVTFDDLYDDLNERISAYLAATDFVDKD